MLAGRGRGDEGASEGLKVPVHTHTHTHLLAAASGGVESVVQAGPVCQPQDLLKQVSAEELEGGEEDEVADPSVLLVAVVAEVDEVLQVVVGTEVLHVLTHTFRHIYGLYIQSNSCQTTYNYHCSLFIIRLLNYIYSVKTVEMFVGSCDLTFLFKLY